MTTDPRIVEVLGNHHAQVGPVSGVWLCKCEASSTNGTLGEGNLTTRVERCHQYDEHLAEAIEPIIHEAKRRAWYEGAWSRQCHCNAHSEGECASGMYPSESNPYQEGPL